MRIVFMLNLILLYFALAENEKIKSAHSILIVGGGPTGVELAGEIAVDFPEKKVTLVHSGSRLMEFIGPKAANKALKWLRSKNVDVKLEQRVDLNSVPELDENGTRIYHSSGGETIKADCHFLCIGKPLGSAWLKGTVLENNLDNQGCLVVDEHLRVKGQKNIFAIGDITNIPVSFRLNSTIILKILGWFCQDPCLPMSHNFDRESLK